MSGSPGTIWKLAGSGDLLWRWWDEQLVVFEPTSGDTHLLNLVAGAVLCSLHEGPRRAAELAERVAARLDMPPDEEQTLQSEIDVLLGDLEAAGLVEVVPP